jgi:UDP-N-acetylglucosamine diphosphorylase/glucosamine-1-phosphate N-acetyltransferase
MKRVILFEDDGYRGLLPLLYWRTVGELLCGYCSLLKRHAPAGIGEVTDLWVRQELAAVSAQRHRLPVNEPIQPAPSDEILLVNARYLPAEAPHEVRPGTVGLVEGQIALVNLPADQAAELDPRTMMSLRPADAPFKNLAQVEAPGAMIDYPWDLISHNQRLLVKDWSGEAQRLGQIADGAHLIRPESISVGLDACVMPGAVLDATDGPIYLGPRVTVSPSAVVQGPCYIGEQTLIQPGAAIRHACCLGPRCKLGGEIEATIIQGYSNKQHDGFLGHAYLGEWVNLGAGTVNSDLKNTYGPVRVPINGREIDSGQTFAGTFIGDHAKTGIGQRFSTGTVVGFAANVATSTFPPKFIPSFSWMTDRGTEHYDPQRCLAVARKVMSRRNVTMSSPEEELFLKLPALAATVEKPTAS